MLPGSADTERILLGGLITESAWLDEVREQIAADSFSRHEHKRLFELLVEMRNRDELIDLTTVIDRIHREGRVDDYGGLAYVMQLTEEIPSAANLPHYASIVHEKAVLRRLIGDLGELLDRAHSDPHDVKGLIDDGAERLFKLSQSGEGRAWKQLSELIDDEMKRIGELSLGKGTRGHTTGFLDLDNKLAGLHPTDLIILAARPAMGKTALALNIAVNVARMEDKPVGIFSLEMGRGQLTTRLLCCEGKVEGEKVRRGTLDDSDREKLVDADDQLRGLQIHIDDSPGLTITELRSRAKRLQTKVQRPLGLIVVDYLQLMQGEDPRAPRQQQIASISRGLKLIAKDLNVPVMALSQLNRGVEARQDKRPLISDLRESGAIEQDADVILFIYRDEVYNPDTEDKGLAEVIIAKQRNGPIGRLKLVFQGRFTRFDDLYEDSGSL